MRQKGILIATVASAILASAEMISFPEQAKADCGWNTAYAPPAGVRGKTSVADCGFIGLTKDTTTTYVWATESTSKWVCVWVATGRRNVWRSGGCGYEGTVTVPWGNVAGLKKLRAATSATFGTIVRWK